MRRCKHGQQFRLLFVTPFAGSGTTLVVAARLDRNYFGIEINPEYKENHIDVRLKEAETGIPIAAARSGHRGLFEKAPAERR